MAKKSEKNKSVTKPQQPKKSEKNPSISTTRPQARRQSFFSSKMLRLGLKILISTLFCLIVRVIYIHSHLPAQEPRSEGITIVYENFTNQKTWIPESSKIIQEHDEILQINTSTYQLPTVFVSVLVRNKAHTLPYFLRGLEIQDYPKNRIAVTFHVDNTLDESNVVLRLWAEATHKLYHRIKVETGEDTLARTRMWTSEHFAHMIWLRQQQLDAARDSWTDFYFAIDADIVLMEPLTLRHLVEASLAPYKFVPDLRTSLPVIAPLLNCTSSESFSNFWGAMTETGYYRRSENYFEIQQRSQLGIFPVPMVHSAYIVNMHHAAVANLSFDPPPANYDGPLDDLIIFARSAQAGNVQFYIDNTRFFGYFASPVDEQDLDGDGDQIDQWLRRDKEMFVHLRLQAAIDLEDRMRVLPSPYLKEIADAQLPENSKLGFDEIYYVNLERRADRRLRTEYFLEQLGIDAVRVNAVDGRNLDAEKLKEYGVKQLEGYEDPYHKRSLKYGEIGCFLSHYKIWQDMLEHGYKRILVLEDDVRFVPGFVRELNEVVLEADTHKPEWELLYIGRKRMSKNETRVPGTRKLAYPDYTYWTLGYVLKTSGAEKLIKQDPLKKMVAVDEYLPIMFNRHPRQSWLDKFGPRNLVALSAEPLLVEPQHYIGEKNYVSDTEASRVIESLTRKPNEL
ncbi:unnamed protein product [Calicophoron daubneyi]|uniref:Glycosyl transferase family 25 domain-containing protein n=1 Tax=Calicophoron daubneyi TaxID=300641 RepID=A0AAV2TYD4_CALDB